MSDGGPRKPKLSVYSNSKSKREENTLVCHASEMFPELVRLQWSVWKGDKWTAVKENEDGVKEMLELGFSDKTRTSMMLVNKQTAGTNRYACSYTHESNDDKSNYLEMPKDGVNTSKASEEDNKPRPTDASIPPIVNTCPPPKISNEYFRATRSLYLATWAYTLMIFKSMVYLCAVSYFLRSKSV